MKPRKWNIYRKDKDNTGASSTPDVSVWQILKLVLFHDDTREYIEIRTGD